MKLARKIVASVVGVTLITSTFGVALADNVVVDQADVSALPGDEIDATVYLIATDSGDVTGCNATSDNPVTVSFESNNTDVADAPASVQLTGCGTANSATATVTVKDEAADEAVAKITVSSATGGRTETRVKNKNTTETIYPDNNVGGEHFFITIDLPDDPCAGASAPAAPTIGITGGTLGSNDWYTVAPTYDATKSADTDTLEWSVDDSTWGPAAPSLGEGTNEIYAREVSDCLPSASDHETIKLDTVNPSVAITGPTDGSTTYASSITVSGTASDDTSGIASVTVNDAAATLGTGTFSRTGVALSCGSNTITAIAADNAGLEDDSEITVTRECYTGTFNQPVDTGKINIAKLGRVIPVKVNLFLNSAPIGSAGGPLVVGTATRACTATTASDSVEEYAPGSSAQGLEFRWDGTEFIYNLDTSKMPSAGTGKCYRAFVNKPGYGTVAYFDIQLTK